MLLHIPILPHKSMKPYKCKKFYLSERFSNFSIAPLWLSDSILPLKSMKSYKCKKISLYLFIRALLKFSNSSIMVTATKEHEAIQVQIILYNYLSERFSNFSKAPLWISHSILPLKSMKPYKCKKNSL